jgi:hypothetical protein
MEFPTRLGQDVAIAVKPARKARGEVGVGGEGGMSAGWSAAKSGATLHETQIALRSIRATIDAGYLLAADGG